ncbi:MULTISPECIES: hypothetical protein [Mesorhizobium]|uniref:hypothetical protein n=1 Tax=Mesorhizobium TaxID=68287 RepID=UPI0010BF783A|nr:MULTISPECIES: hypothetical protein [Mesorhizobium]
MRSRSFCGARFIELHVFKNNIDDLFLVTLIQARKRGFDFHFHQPRQRVWVEWSDQQVPKLMLKLAQFGMKPLWEMMPR